MLFFKQSEHSYYAFWCIDLLTVTENQMILTAWCIGTCPHRKEKRSKRENLVHTEVLCLKESEQSYYAFRCIDLLTVTENQMILTPWCIGTCPHRKENKSKRKNLVYTWSVVFEEIGTKLLRISMQWLINRPWKSNDT